MKKIQFLFVLIAISLISISFNSLNKYKNLVLLHDNLYVQKYEVSNGDWLSYLQAIKENKSDYSAALPDTTVWRETGKTNEPYVHYYLRHPAYKNYPVVGVSYEQAVNYCIWKTKNNTDNLKYRLPTKSEWLEFSYFDILEKYKKKIKKSYKNYIELNNKLIFGNLQSRDKVQKEISAPVDSYFPNSIGLFNVFGNVSEMISEKGIAFGGDYETELSDIKTDYSKTYVKPTKEIGFRIVAEKSK